MSVHVEYLKEQQKNKELFATAEHLWQTLNALHLLVGDKLAEDTKQHVREVLADYNPSKHNA